MYSIVMLTALSAAPDAPQFNGYFRDLFGGGNGCCGGARYSGGCSGSMAYSNSCSGCCGGGSVFGLGLGDRVRRFFERDPIGYGCCGGRSYGCSGSSLSCSGYSCFGCGAMSYTPMSGAGLSCSGGTYAVPQPGFDAFPPMPNVRPGPGAPNIPYAIPDSAPGTGFRVAPQPGAALASTGPTARATVIVRLPADARLTADARALNLTGAERKFVSPDLPADQEFVYKFTAEYERDGEIVAVTKKVAVRAGITTSVAFADLAAARSSDAPGATTSTAPAKGAVPTSDPAKAAPPAPKPPTDVPPNPTAGDRATITVKVPADATLYVDDRKSPSREPVRSFATPPLPAGREFAYVIKAEVIRNGQPETLTQKVPFRAGERVTVDFTSLGK
jgi:uncharacterized protein (TIGR03000 family)